MNGPTISRRGWLKAASGLAAVTLPVAGHEGPADRDGNRLSASELDQQWKTYVDSGIYPLRPHLFLDDLYVERMEGVGRVAYFPKKVNDRPVLQAEKPWEGVSMVFRNSIIYDHKEKLFKIWYRGYDPKLKSVSHSRWAYATSPDGIHWTRPDLGLVEFDGSRKNNLISFGKNNDYNALLHNVVRDGRDENPARRFKAIGTDAHPVQAGDIPVPYLRKTGFETTGGLFAAYSPDGVHWTMRRGWLAGMLLRDGSTLHGYNEKENRWVLWQRPAYTRGIRMIGVSYSHDFEHWTLPEFGLQPDQHDPPGMQFDQLTTLASPDGGYIGLVAASGWSGKGFNSGEEMPQLVYSRDPRSWTRVSREMFLKPGVEGSWDEGTVIPTNPIVIDDDVFCFFYGKNRGGAWGQPTYNGKRTTTAALGLAKMKRDRWVSMSPTGAQGSFTTSMIFFSGDELRVNVDARGGSLRAELQDYHGNPIPHYTLDDCIPVTGDTMDQLVAWKDNRNRFTSLIGTATHYPPEISRAMRIKFSLERADQFSFSC